MRIAGRGKSRGLWPAIACAALAVPTTAAAAQPTTESLPATTFRLTSPKTTARACTTLDAATVTRPWVARETGYVRARLGDARGDWDLALFASKRDKRVDASVGWGATEVVQSWARKGESLLVVACRHNGASRSARLTIDAVKVDLPPLPTVKPKPRRLVSIVLKSRADFGRLQALHINTDESPDASGRSVAAVLEGDQPATLARNGFVFLTLDSNVDRSERRFRQQDAAAAAAAEASPLPSGRSTYRHYPDIQADLKKIATDHPDIARPIELPKKSFQGRAIQGLEISANVAAPDDGKPTFFLMGAHHAREWPSAEIPVEMAIYLTKNYGKDERVTKLLDNVRVTIVPVINPDGYISSREANDPADTLGDPTGSGAPFLAESVAPPGGALAYRRKNCDGASSNPATPCELQYGVDPNRNYGFNWGGKGAGTDPNGQTYRGTGMWSEPETKAVHEYSQTHPVTTLVTMHNFASLVLRPPGTAAEGQAPDEDALKELGDAMGRDTGYTSQYGYQLYDTSGTTEDWNYGAAGTFGYTIEMGPASDKGGNFHISYDRAVIAQWTGSESEQGKGKGLRDALLLAGEEAASRDHFASLSGTAPPDSVLRLHKDFTTFSAELCAVETTGVSCQGQGTLPRQSQPDFLDYTTKVRPDGTFDWIVTPSSRPFELKAGREEQYTLTCEDPVSKKVYETRKVVVDRGQRLELDLDCGRPKAAVDEAASDSCVDQRKLTLKVHQPRRGKLRQVSVLVDGKRKLTLKGKKARAGVVTLEDLRPRKSPYKVTVIAYGSDGYRRLSTRRYSTCRKGRPSSSDTRGGKK